MLTIKNASFAIILLFICFHASFFPPFSSPLSRLLFFVLKFILSTENMKKTKQPLVSVIMPVYNAGVYLVEAVESIINQTYSNYELIIVDDASTDNSWIIISKLKKKYPVKIKAIHLDKQTNSAGNGATNYGLKFAKGDFIVRMDADDISLPTRIGKQVKFMIENPNVILLGTQAEIIDNRGAITGKKNVPTSHEEIYEAYGIIHPMIHPSCMVRRNLLPDKDRLYEDKFGVNDDYYTFFRLLNYGKFANLPDALIKYRVHNQNASLQKPKQKFINSLKIRFKAIDKFYYQISPKAVIVMLIQSIIVFLIPEKMVVPMYMAIRSFSGSNVRKYFRNDFSYIFKKYYTSITQIIF